MTETSLKERREARRKRRAARRAGEDEEDDVAVVEDRSVTVAKGRATPSRRKGSTEASGNAVTRPFTGARNYFAGVRSEIEKVTWPDREETTRLTYIVLAVTVASSLALGLISIVFSELFQIGLRQPLVVLGVFALAIIAGVVFNRVRDSRTL